MGKSDSKETPKSAAIPGASRPGEDRKADPAARPTSGERLDPLDQPPADVLDDENLAGEKDFELRPPVA